MKGYYIILALIALFCVTSCSNDNTIDTPSTQKILTITPDTLILRRGESFQLKAKLNNKELKGTELEWVSNSIDVAIDSMGLLSLNEYSINTYYYQVSAILKEDHSIAANCNIAIATAYKYRIQLKNKDNSDHSLNSPRKYLSEKAITRRRKRNIAIDSLDLPISSKYLQGIQNAGGIIVTQSKWLNTVCVIMKEGYSIENIAKLAFVEKCIPVSKEFVSLSHKNKNLDINTTLNRSISYDQSDYSKSWDNIDMVKGQKLHELGYRGQNMDIAIIDAGFMNITSNPSLQNMKIKGAKSFIYEDKDPYLKDYHGVQVVSCMATNKPQFYIGTAPEANYWLLRSEDTSSECPIEEDYWVAAVEYADSVGVDIVNTSLGYKRFDIYEYNHAYEEMNGQTAPPSRAANIAFDKGIFIVCAAGNESSWVGTPSDSPNVLTVGAIDSYKNIASFSSYGTTVDGRLKPDIVSLGFVSLIDTEGQLAYGSGTSYSTPIVCGLVACLWQAYPNLSNKELFDLIIKSSDRSDKPLLPYGYGIPNMEKAIDILNN